MPGPHTYQAVSAAWRLAPPERTRHGVAGVQIGDFHGDHAVFVDDVGLFDKRAILGTNDRNGRQIDVGATQGMIEGDDHFAVGLQVSAGNTGLVERRILDEAEIADVVRSAVAALDRQRFAGSKLGVRLQKGIERDERTGLALTEDADATGELFAHRVRGFGIGTDGQANRG